MALLVDERLEMMKARLTYAASPPRWTRRSGDEKERATRSETGDVSGMLVFE